MLKALLNSIFILVCFSLLLAVTLRGLPGNPTIDQLLTKSWQDDGPFELSPERGRFALTLSLAETGSVIFPLSIARFGTPDTGYFNGNFVSLFAPGVSWVVLPGYLLGKSIGLAQVGTYATVSLFAVFNALLITWIVRRLELPWAAAWLAALTFLFATPAFAYGVSLYQHHLSTFVILLGILCLTGTTRWWKLALSWLACGTSVVIDYPNAIMMAPVGVVALSRAWQLASTIPSQKSTVQPAQSLRLYLGRLVVGCFALVPILALLWFNVQSYGSPWKLSGTAVQVKAIDEQGRPVVPKGYPQTSYEEFLEKVSQEKSAVGFFTTRNMINGFYIHFLSPDRGLISFTPVMLLGILGIFLYYRKKPFIAALLMGVIGSNWVLYAMWGDPYGGWAFGSRYLIPTYAILSLGLAYLLNMLANSWKTRTGLLIFLVLFGYSVWINTLGAVTTNRNPPQVEILGLEALSGREEKYTWERNWDALQNGAVKSFAYNYWLKTYVTPLQFHQGIVGIVLGLGILATGSLVISKVLANRSLQLPIRADSIRKKI